MTALVAVASHLEADPLTREVARLLTNARKERGMTFRELALKTGLGQATVVRYLYGERTTPLDAFVIICDALQLDPAVVIAEAQRGAGWQ